MTGMPSGEPLFAPGTRLGHTYTVEAFLGAGAFGQVYRVTHRFLGRQALKIFPPGGPGPERDFAREARILVEFTHPNIVRIFDANVLDSPFGQLPYLAMEYVDGETIGQLLKRRVRLRLTEADALADDLSAGMSEAHRLEPPLLHLDLTTDNVLVTTVRGHQRAKIADFGIAAHLNPTTRMARAQGTYYFMAPEMFWGYATPASDVYALAFLIYWLYSGVPPYPLPELSPGASSRDSADAVQLARKVPPPSLSRFRLDVPDGVAAVVEQALAPDPRARFSDAVAFRQALQAARDPSGPHLDDGELRLRPSGSLLGRERSCACHRFAEKHENGEWFELGAADAVDRTAGLHSVVAPGYRER